MSKLDPFRTPPAFDASAITATIERALASAGLRTTSGPMRDVTRTIEDALAAAGLMPRGDATAKRGIVIEGTARRVAPDDARDSGRLDAPRPVERPAATEAPPAPPGEFLTRSFAAASGARTYKIYVPAGYAAGADDVPMVVMLHGCTQPPDDFAAGTRMNAVADEHGFIVVYPAQSASANAQKCWNWFRTEDQTRESGEPAIIAGITREVAATYRIDRRRIFVAGLSAGAAMAVILATTHPDLYAAVGAHSGLAYRAASDMPSAFRAMHGASVPVASLSGTALPVPVIVFHGDCDRTVNAANATAIVRQAAGASKAHEATSGTGACGRRFSRKVYANASGSIVAEHWVVHGAGHAWSGGSTTGSFADEAGPDASREMVRFFLALARAGTA